MENLSDGMGFLRKDRFFMLTTLLKMIFGTKSQRDVRRMQPLVAFAPQEIARGEMYQMLAGGVV